LPGSASALGIKLLPELFIDASADSAKVSAAREAPLLPALRALPRRIGAREGSARASRQTRNRCPFYAQGAQLLKVTVEIEIA